MPVWVGENSKHNSNNIIQARKRQLSSESPSPNPISPNPSPKTKLMHSFCDELKEIKIELKFRKVI